MQQRESARKHEGQSGIVMEPQNACVSVGFQVHYSEKQRHTYMYNRFGRAADVNEAKQINDSHQPGGCGRCFRFYFLNCTHTAVLYMPSPARASELYSLRKHFSITYIYKTCFTRSHEYRVFMYSCQVGARCPLCT